jgi:hypothetical protein
MRTRTWLWALLASAGCLIENPAVELPSGRMFAAVTEGCGGSDWCSKVGLVVRSEAPLMIVRRNEQEYDPVMGFVTAVSSDPTVVEGLEARAPMVRVRAVAPGSVILELRRDDGSRIDAVWVDVAAVVSLSWVPATVAIGAPVTLMVAASAYGALGGRGGIDFAADAPVRLQPCARMGDVYRVTDCVIAQSDVPGTFPVRAMAHQGPRAIMMLEVVAPEDYATVNLAVSRGSIGAVLYTAEQHTIVGARCDWIVEGAPEGTTFTQAPVPVPPSSTWPGIP